MGARTGQHEVIAEFKVEQAGQRCELNGCELKALKLVSAQKWELREEKEKGEKQASEKDLSAIFEHPSSRIELRKEEMAGQGQ
jgi:hypothetical protein